VRNMAKMMFVLAAILFALSVAATSFADPGLGRVEPHRHYIKTSQGTFVEVGPRVCDNPTLQGAFNQFHNNIHRLTADSIGPVAPGLHNFVGAEIMAGGC
jgi:hypothetical protein